LHKKLTPNKILHTIFPTPLIMANVSTEGELLELNAGKVKET
jgi:hypothetical protein